MHFLLIAIVWQYIIHAESLLKRIEAALQRCDPTCCIIRAAAYASEHSGCFNACWHSN